jgi:hypothetical protein
LLVEWSCVVISQRAWHKDDSLSRSEEGERSEDLPVPGTFELVEDVRPHRTAITKQRLVIYNDSVAPTLLRDRSYSIIHVF